MQNKIKFGELLFFIMGVFSTTPILEVCVGGKEHHTIFDNISCNADFVMGA